MNLQSNFVIVSWGFFSKGVYKVPDLTSDKPVRLHVENGLVVNGATHNVQCATFSHFKFIAYTSILYGLT